jgi:hypothetical protein
MRAALPLKRAFILCYDAVHRNNDNYLSYVKDGNLVRMLHKRKSRTGLQGAQAVANRFSFSNWHVLEDSLICHRESAEYFLHDEPGGSRATH